MNCKYCNEPLHLEDGVYVDNTSGDCCTGNKETGENENQIHIPMDNEHEPGTLAQFINDVGITLETVRINGRPDITGDDWSNDARHWRVTLIRLRTSALASRKRLSLYFSQGSAHTVPPTVTDVLSCLADDASSVENAGGFDEWCSELGYDTDSRKAERTFKATQSQARKLEKFLGEELYDRLVNHTERD